MGYPIKLKTGFFETCCYNLEIRDEDLLFRPQSEELIPALQISFSDLLEFSISEGAHPELEVITKCSLYTCVFDGPVSIPSLAEELHVKSRKQIRIEEERK
jgi:hypothetical protein